MDITYTIHTSLTRPFFGHLKRRMPMRLSIPVFISSVSVLLLAGCETVPHYPYSSSPPIPKGCIYYENNKELVNFNCLYKAANSTTYRYTSPRSSTSPTRINSHQVLPIPKPVSAMEINNINEENTKNREYPFCVTIAPLKGLAGPDRFTNVEAYAAAWYNNLPSDSNGNPIVHKGDAFCIEKDGDIPIKQDRWLTKDSQGCESFIFQPYIT